MSSAKAKLVLKNSWKCFGGVVRKYTHSSLSTKTEMTFSVFLPSAALQGNKVPVLYYLSGLTCNEDNFITKAGAPRIAEKRQIALVCPDTSPRGLDLPGEHDSYDFGSGAGFYVDATAEPWSTNYHMYSYVTKELPELVRSELPVSDKQSIFGHSMGGHGALICFLKNPNMFESVSAFSPICNPIECPWGTKALGGYLGDNKDAWKAWDASELLKTYDGPKKTLLIEQGADDEFLEGKQLLPDNLLAVAKDKEYPVDYRLREGYDHSYWFISTFVEDHIHHHADALLGNQADTDDAKADK